MFPKIGVPQKKTLILIGFSTINQPAIAVAPFMETHNWLVVSTPLKNVKVN